MTKPNGTRAMLALGGVALCAGGVVSTVLALTSTPRHDVDAWLHVTDAQLAWCTLEVQVVTVIVMVGLGIAAVAGTLLGHIAAAIKTGVGLLMGPVVAIFVLPHSLLSHRATFIAAPFGGPALRVEYPTDFDYRTYLPHLLDALIAPALGSLAAAALLGGTFAAAARYWPRQGAVEK